MVSTLTKRAAAMMEISAGSPTMEVRNDDFLVITLQRIVCYKFFHFVGCDGGRAQLSGNAIVQQPFDATEKTPWKREAR